jgi:hypothetical protein
VNYNGAGVAEAFYQPVPYRCSDDVNVLFPRFALTSKSAMFISTVIRWEKYSFSYGRKWHLERMQKSEIRLLATSSDSLDLAAMEENLARFPASEQIISKAQAKAGG